MIGRTNTGGCGGGGLNFQVIGGTTAPSNPKENMIWINTSTTITDYVFSATQPSAATGRVWISTGTSSQIEFNALKKNGIQVYPISAKQYVSGAWVEKTAMSYQGGQWVEWWVWNGDLFVNGDQIEKVTGGWKAVNGAGSKAEIGDVIKFTVPGSSGRDAAVFTKNKVNFDGYSQIKFTINVTSTLGPVRVGVTTANTSYAPEFAAYTETSSTGSRTLTVKLGDAPKECYVSVYADQSALTVSKIQAS